MAETKALTFSLTANATAVSVVLKSGAPWENGPVLAQTQTVLWRGSGLTEADVRAGILEDKPSSTILQKTGVHLGQLLLGADIGAAWAAKGADVRCYLESDPGLEWIPWETAIQPVSLQPLFINLSTPFLRYHDPVKSVPRPLCDRLVMLVVVSVEDWEAIGAGQELRLLREAIRPVDRLIQMVILRNPSRQKMFDEIVARKPAILHFIGHGDAAELKLWTGAQNESWARQDIGADLDNAKWTPNFVFLNACHSLTRAAPKGLTARTWSVAGIFLEKGAAAVLAMQGPISGEAAGLFSQQFYTAVAQGECVDVAITRSRNQLRLHAIYGKTREPFLPALVANISPDGLLACSSCRDEDGWIDQRIYKGLISNCELLLPAVNQFVDRDQHRWDLLDQLNRAVDSKLACIITGPSGIGKTWLLAWCIDGWLRRRYRVHYVRMSGCANWLEFIRTLRDGRAEPGVVHEPLPQPAGDHLNWRLSHLARGATRRPEGTMPNPVPPEKIDLAKVKKKAPEFHVHALAALAEALTLDPQNPVVLVLDDFGDGKNQFPSPDLGLFVTHFVKAQVLARRTGIRVVMSISESELFNYPGVLPASIAPVQVPYLSEDLEENIRLAYKLRYQTDLPGRSETDLPKLAKRPRTGAELSILCKRIYDYDQELG